MALRRDKQGGKASARAAASAARIDSAVAKTAARTKTGPDAAELTKRIRALVPYAEGSDPEPPERGAALPLLMWALLHERVLKVLPVEDLTRGRWFAAMAAVKEILPLFDDDIEECADFVRWAWRREVATAIPFRQSKGIGGRLEWRKCFAHSKVVTYKVERRMEG